MFSVDLLPQVCGDRVPLNECCMDVVSRLLSPCQHQLCTYLTALKFCVMLMLFCYGSHSTMLGLCSFLHTTLCAHALVNRLHYIHHHTVTHCLHLSCHSRCFGW